MISKPGFLKNSSSLRSNLQNTVPVKQEYGLENLNNTNPYVSHKNLFCNDKQNALRMKLSCEDNDKTNTQRFSNWIYSIGSRTRAGFNGISMKTNQDSFIYNKMLMGDPEKSFLAVFDGHGSNGHKVSQYLKLHCIEFLIKRFTDSLLREDPKTKNINEIELSDLQISTLLKNVFVETNRELNNKLPRMTELSGSTATSVLIYNKKLFCANLGDSETAVLVQTSTGHEIIKLCVCHLPTVEEEKKRILEAGGRIEPIKLPNGEDIGPPRIWLKNTRMPGLMMSRTFGDRVGHMCGITDIPEVMIETLTSNHLCLVLGSDGLFDGVDTVTLKDILLQNLKAKDSSTAAEQLLEKATTGWKEKDLSNYRDDITVLVSYLQN